jgi:acyl-CoA hydrolase
MNTLKSIDTFETVHSFTVFPDHLNYHGTLFGGKILAELDIAAVKTVRRLLYSTDCDGTVTACVNNVNFDKPAYLGDIIEIQSRVVRLGKTSVEIMSILYKEDAKGKVEKIAQGKLTFVSMKEGKPYPHNFILVKPSLN